MKFFAGAYWGDRAETAEECARKLSSFLASLQEIHPDYAEWFEKGRSARAAKAHRIELSIPAMTSRVLMGQHLDDETGAPIIELGFSLSIWNGKRDGASLSVTCGLNAGNRFLGNAIVLDLPDAVLSSLGNSDLAQLLSVFVEIWEPESATISNTDLRAAQRLQQRGAIVGWSTYFRTAIKPIVERPVRTLPFDSGYVVLFERDPRDTSIEAVLMLRGSLKSQGLL